MDPGILSQFKIIIDCFLPLDNTRITIGQWIPQSIYILMEKLTRGDFRLIHLAGKQRARRVGTGQVTDEIRAIADPIALSWTPTGSKMWSIHKMTHSAAGNVFTQTFFTPVSTTELRIRLFEVWAHVLSVCMCKSIYMMYW